MSNGSDAKLIKAGFGTTSARKMLFSVMAAAVLAPSTGCHVIGLPSHRYGDAAGGNVTCEGGYCTADSASDDCTPGFLPPLPGWLAEWRIRRHNKKALPEAPEFPRFHPVPTRPMFTPQPGQAFDTQYPGMAMEGIPAGAVTSLTIESEGGDVIDVVNSPDLTARNSERSSSVYGRLPDALR